MVSGPCAPFGDAFTFGTLMYLARQAGVEVKTGGPDHSASVQNQCSPRKGLYTSTRLRRYARGERGREDLVLSRRFSSVIFCAGKVMVLYSLGVWCLCPQRGHRHQTPPLGLYVASFSRPGILKLCSINSVLRHALKFYPWASPTLLTLGIAQASLALHSLTRKILHFPDVRRYSCEDVRRHGRGDPCGRPPKGRAYPRMRTTARVAPTRGIIAADVLT